LYKYALVLSEQVVYKYSLVVIEPEDQMKPTALETANRYHDAWTRGSYDVAASLLAPDLVVEVPINEYPDAASFAEAVAQFGRMTTSVTMLSAMGDDMEAVLVYDMVVDGIGSLRVAEHFTVADGRITRVRQIHDTAALRAAGVGA
jgi:ketosteroid isomerase-like protein